MPMGFMIKGFILWRSVAPPWPHLLAGARGQAELASQAELANQLVGLACSIRSQVTFDWPDPNLHCLSEQPYDAES